MPPTRADAADAVATALRHADPPAAARPRIGAAIAALAVDRHGDAPPWRHDPERLRRQAKNHLSVLRHTSDRHLLNAAAVAFTAVGGVHADGDVDTPLSPTPEIVDAAARIGGHAGGDACPENIRDAAAALARACPDAAADATRGLLLGAGDAAAPVRAQLWRVAARHVAAAQLPAVVADALDTAGKVTPAIADALAAHPDAADVAGVSRRRLAAAAASADVDARAYLADHPDPQIRAAAPPLRHPAGPAATTVAAELAGAATRQARRSHDDDHTARTAADAAIRALVVDHHAAFDPPLRDELVWGHFAALATWLTGAAACGHPTRGDVDAALGDPPGQTIAAYHRNAAGGLRATSRVDPLDADARFGHAAAGAAARWPVDALTSPTTPHPTAERVAVALAVDDHLAAAARDLADHVELWRDAVALLPTWRGTAADLAATAAAARAAA